MMWSSRRVQQALQRARRQAAGENPRRSRAEGREARGGHRGAQDGPARPLRRGLAQLRLGLSLLRLDGTESPLSFAKSRLRIAGAMHRLVAFPLCLEKSTLRLAILTHCLAG